MSSKSPKQLFTYFKMWCTCPVARPCVVGNETNPGQQCSLQHGPPCSSLRFAFILSDSSLGSHPSCPNRPLKPSNFSALVVSLAMTIPSWTGHVTSPDTLFYPRNYHVVSGTCFKCEDGSQHEVLELKVINKLNSDTCWLLIERGGAELRTPFPSPYCRFLGGHADKPEATLHCC